ncbi:thiolase-like protein [Massariosphaeria phaeospora]|uniref:Thiolase-like protein n=1 Tax=Massariosphaeria phaeospora TaxID=100035 RepID=A0A7C8I722_9PLEO|nr:thiolase-like protein [Massariosphaeria phaeospora]
MPYEAIAIISFALKFPQDAVDQESFWKLLLEKRSACTTEPPNRYNVTACRPLIKEDVGAFDAAFFGISPEEAECMDPQQFWLLETSYQALENSGISLKEAAGSNTSVHVGCCGYDFAMMAARDPELLSRDRVIGTLQSNLANQLSWFYDFHGPSTVVDTGCSSSLVALDMACQSLHSGDANMAMVAGCNLVYDPAATEGLDRLNVLSPDGKCFSFDSRANGYSRGEGIGCVVLKPLSAAIEGGYTIRAVIRATGSSQNGRTPRMGQPCGKAQASLIRSVYRRADLDIALTRYFEAHGTDTPRGDPTEAEAIANAFRGHTSPEDKLHIGAVKSNIGHLKGASGMAGLIKAVLVLEKGIIPANIWVDRINPRIHSSWNLNFPKEALPWPIDGLRRASVNSFGLGGTNAHAVLDDAYH